MVGYLKKRSREAGSRGFLKPFVSAECNRLGMYALKARTTERPFLLDPSGKKIGLSEPGTAGTVDMLRLRRGRLQ